MKYALAKARKLAVEFGLNPDLEADFVHQAEKLVREVLTEAYNAAEAELMGDDTDADNAVAAVKDLADKEVE